MKTNEVFLKAKKDRNLRNMLIIDRIDEVTNSRRQLIRLCVDLKKKYSSDLIPETEFIECDTEIRYENYSYFYGCAYLPGRIYGFGKVEPWKGPGGKARICFYRP